MVDDKNNSASSATIQEYLKGINYPAKKEDLVNHARSQNAPQSVLDTLDGMPDREYGGPADVTSEIWG